MICYQGWTQIVVIEKFLLNRQIIVTRVMSSRNVLVPNTYPKKVLQAYLFDDFRKNIFFTLNIHHNPHGFTLVALTKVVK